VLDAEFFSRGQKRVVCRYDELMSNWQALVGKITRGLGISFPRNSPKVHAEISQFLTQAQRHHKVDNAAVAENPSYSHWLRTTFKIMLNWSEHGENVADHAVLDEIRTELDRSYDTFASLLLKPELTGLPSSGGQLRDELSIVQAEIERLGTELGERTASQERGAELRAQREAELTARINEETANTQALQAEIERLGTELGERTASQEREAELRAQREAELTARINEETANTQSLQAALERRERAEAQLRETSNEVQDEKLRNAELTGQISALQSSLVQRQEELAQFLNEFKKSESGRGAAEAELEQVRQRRIELEQANGSYECRVDALTADLMKMTSLLQQQEDASKKLSVELSARAAETEQKLAARFGELAQLTIIAAQETERAEALQSHAEWLSDVRRLEESFPIWWAIMPQAWQTRRKHRRYRGAGLFDADAYLALFPDVAEQGMDPVRHYILHGMPEGRTRPDLGNPGR
jgi:myosin heavy subunit